MNRTGHARFCALLFGLVAGCQSPESAEEFKVGRSLPYRIYIYVDVPMSNQDEPTGDQEKATTTAIPVDAQNIEEEIVEVAGPLKLCTEIVSRETSEQDLEASLEDAREKGADLVLRVECRGPEYRFSHRNAWFLPNTILWFVLGFPSFYVSDREYEVKCDIRYHLYATNGKELGTSTEPITLSTHVPLSVVERDFSVEALYMPPGFFRGSDFGDKLTQDAEDLLKKEIIDMLKEDRIQLSQNWGKEIEIRVGETDVTVRIDTEATLLRLRLELDGELLAEADLHSMSGLVDTPELPDGSRVYEWKRSLARILDDVKLNRPSKFTDWNGTKTISFKTQHDDQPHLFRVLARTRPIARSTFPQEPAAP